MRDVTSRTDLAGWALRTVAVLAGAALLAGCVIVDSDGRSSEEAGLTPVRTVGAGSEVTEQAGLTPEPVADIETVPVNPLDLRRTTLVVRDIEQSLALYRDALGMTVEYDQTLSSPDLDMRFGADGENRSRLVLLKANDDFIGMLGLWQFLDQTEQDLADPDPADFTPGEIVLLFNTKTLDETFASAAASPGVTVVGEPRERRYPSPAGEIVVMVSMLVDPDGHTLELNQIISDPRTP